MINKEGICAGVRVKWSQCVIGGVGGVGGVSSGVGLGVRFVARLQGTGGLQRSMGGIGEMWELEILRPSQL